MNPKPIVIMRQRRVVARVVSPTHPLYEREVEVTGRGRGGYVFASVDGTEAVFLADQLCELS